MNGHFTITVSSTQYSLGNMQSVAVPYYEHGYQYSHNPEAENRLFARTRNA